VPPGRAEHVAVHRRGDGHHLKLLRPDKVWVTGPAGEKLEVYTVLADSDTFGSSPQHLEDPNARGGVCCGGTAPDSEKAAAGTSCC
jgi:lactoylglutathione lyase